MKQFMFLAALFLGTFALSTTSCTKDPETVTIDSSQPNGDFTASRSGTFVAENGAPTAGMAEVGTDTDNTNFLRFSTDFTTELGTGTVSVYFSTSDTFTADPMNGNPDLMLVGNVAGNGEQYFRLSSAVPSNFTHVILWCNTASVPFGNSPLN